MPAEPASPARTSSTGGVPSSPPRHEEAPARRMLARLAVAECLALTMWFSATAVAGGLKSRFGIADSDMAWLAMAVQAGFVVGALISASLNLADIVRPRRLFAAGAMAGALANAAITLSGSASQAIVWRFLTGAALALVYPPGLKIAAGWFLRGRGTALAVVVGALTLGSALPHLLAAISVTVGWQWLVLCSSGCAVLAAGIMLWSVRDGPYVSTTAPFDPRAVARVFTDRRTRLATFGYLGHMWELYAMWTWLASFAAASLAAIGLDAAARRGSLAAFLAIGFGAFGCMGAGLLADRIGRARVAAWAMIVSGACCALAGFVFNSSSPWLYGLVLVWGISVVADSALFSALVTDYSPTAYVGTALTVQLCSGFLLTLMSIRLIPVLAAVVGWQWAFAALVPGPAIGAWVMLALAADERVSRPAKPYRS